MSKYLVPLVTVAALIYSGMHPSNFGHNFHEFMPYGVKSVLVGIVSAGVVMSFNGFQSPLNFSEEVKNPRNAIITNTLIGCIYLLVFKGWYILVGVISVLHIFSYLAAPIITIANRHQNKKIMNHKDQFKLKGAYILAPILLYVLSNLLFFAEWPLTGEMFLLILPGLFFFFYYDNKYFSHEPFLEKFKGASWLVFYIFGISLITYLGNNSNQHELISTTTSMILLLVLSSITYVHGAFFAIPKK